MWLRLDREEGPKATDVAISVETNPGTLGRCYTAHAKRELVRPDEGSTFDVPEEGDTWDDLTERWKDQELTVELTVDAGVITGWSEQ
jgi:hypothetical protein